MSSTLQGANAELIKEFTGAGAKSRCFKTTLHLHFKLFTQLSKSNEGLSGFTVCCMLFSYFHVSRRAVLFPTVLVLITSSGIDCNLVLRMASRSS